MTSPTTTVVSERALLLLEIIAKAEEPPSLSELIALIELRKPPRIVSRPSGTAGIRAAHDGRQAL